MTEEEIIEYCKKHYPPGTVFKPAHVNDGGICTVPDNCKYLADTSHCWVLDDTGNSIQSNTRMMGVVLEVKLTNYKWAEIVSKPEIKNELTVGRYVKVISNYMFGSPDDGNKRCNDSNFYKIGKIGKITAIRGEWIFLDNHSNGITENQLELMPIDYNPNEPIQYNTKSNPFIKLNIGDVITREELSAWVKLDNNSYYDGKWRKGGDFFDDDEIKGFDYIEATKCFQVTRSANNYYIKTDGFEEWLNTFRTRKRWLNTFKEREEQILNNTTIPEYVECIKLIHGNINPKIGDIIKTDINGNLIGYCMYNSLTYKECFIPSTKEAYDKQELLKEAKKRYPIGTGFIAVRGKDSIGGYNHIISLDLEWQYGNGISHVGIGYVYTHESGWAEIVSLPNLDTGIKVSLPSRGFYSEPTVNKKDDNSPFQEPVLLNNKKSKSKLIIINQ